VQAVSAYAPPVHAVTAVPGSQSSALPAVNEIFFIPRETVPGLQGSPALHLGAQAEAHTTPAKRDCRLAVKRSVIMRGWTRGQIIFADPC
jgi:hypothetical protein